MAKTTKKAAPVKRKYVKKSQHWKQSATEGSQPATNKELLSLVIEGVDLLSLNDKAKVLAHILGKESFDERQLWAVEKILSK